MPLSVKDKIVEGKKIVGKVVSKKVIVGVGKPLVGLNGKVKANAGKSESNNHLLLQTLFMQLSRILFQ